MPDTGISTPHEAQTFKAFQNIGKSQEEFHHAVADASRIITLVFNEREMNKQGEKLHLASVAFHQSISDVIEVLNDIILEEQEHHDKLHDTQNQEAHHDDPAAHSDTASWKDETGSPKPVLSHNYNPNMSMAHFPDPPKLDLTCRFQFNAWRHLVEDKLRYDNFPSDQAKGAYVFSRLGHSTPPGRTLLPGNKWGSPQQVAYEWIKENNGIYTHTELLDFLESKFVEED
jgi:hypothetical protein